MGLERSSFKKPGWEGALARMIRAKPWSAMAVLMAVEAPMAAMASILARVLKRSTLSQSKVRVSYVVSEGMLCG